MSETFFRTVAKGLWAAAAAAAALGVQAQTHRVSGWYSGNYEAVTTLSFPPNGTFSRTDTLGGVWNSGATSSLAALPLSLATPPASLWTDTVGLGMTDVAYALSSSTDFRHNHAKASLADFVAVDATTSTQFCQYDIDGVCIPGTQITVDRRLKNEVWAYAASRWEEVYHLGGGTGAGQLQPTYHVDATLGPTGGSTIGDASFSWRQSDFLGNTVLGIQASYGAAGDNWSVDRYNPGTGYWVNSTGSGPLTISEDITGVVNFTFGTPFYVDSYLVTFVNGNGVADLSSSVTLTQLALPAATLLFVASGTDYTGVAQFAGGSGALCPTLACTIGGGTPPIPEPRRSALLLAGLAAVGLLVRRRAGRV